MKNASLAIILALLAALFYAIGIPLSKQLLTLMPPTFLAATLYLGAGISAGCYYLAIPRHRRGPELTRSDLRYTLGMIILDCIAPIFLMIGLSQATAANVSLLNNFEIVATTLLALIIFKERVSGVLWGAIGLVSCASILLSIQDAQSLQFSTGSIFVLLACLCWGLENNCTRKIADKSTSQIVMVKGVFSGLASLLIAWVIGESLFWGWSVFGALGVGVVAYGLSIYLYVRAQKDLGAAKTSAFYATAPFIGVGLSYLFLQEAIGITFVIALLLMIIGTILIVLDILFIRHRHRHIHLDAKTNHHIEHIHYHWHRLGLEVHHTHTHPKCS